MENSNKETIQMKKRKTIDEYLHMDKWNINVLLIIAILGNLFFKGGIIIPIASFCGLDAIYYLVKRRKELTKKQKFIGWSLVFLWIFIAGVVRQFI